MLILLQDGNRAINLDNVSCIEICRYCRCDLVVHYLYHGADFSPTDVGSVSPRHVKTFYLGGFRSEDSARKALADILDAYERGARVYRLPSR